jgi:hypothetical protein
MVLLSLLVFPSMLLRRDIEPQTILFVDLPLFFGATIAVLLYYLVSQRAATGGGRGALRYMPAVMGLGIGLAVNNARAAVEGLYQPGGVFERTPKYRIEARTDGWQRKRYRARSNWSAILEGALSVYFAFCFVAATVTGMWASLPFLYLFLQGYAYMFFLSLVSGTGRRAGERRFGYTAVPNP